MSQQFLTLSSEVSTPYTTKVFSCELLSNLYLYIVVDNYGLVISFILLVVNCFQICIFTSW